MPAFSLDGCLIKRLIRSRFNSINPVYSCMAHHPMRTFRHLIFLIFFRFLVEKCLFLRGDFTARNFKSADPLVSFLVTVCEKIGVAASNISGSNDEFCWGFWRKFSARGVSRIGVLGIFMMSYHRYLATRILVCRIQNFYMIFFWKIVIIFHSLIYFCFDKSVVREHPGEWSNFVAASGILLN